MRDPSVQFKQDNLVRNTATNESSPDIPTVLVLGGSFSKKLLLESHIQLMTSDKFEVLHIQGLPKRHGEFNTKLGLPNASMLETGILENILVKGRTIMKVIPLVDSLVRFADIMNKQAGVPTNDIETWRCRVDKGCMQECLKSQGLSFCQSVRVSSCEEALYAWTNSFGRRPVVLKPPQSGGSDGVILCRSSSEIAAYMKIYLHKVNLERNLNSEIIMQEYVVPVWEYIVNTVSLNGSHKITDVWVSPPKHGEHCRFLYDYQKLVPCPPQSVLSYTFQVLDACGVVSGACHTEVAWLASGQCKLIEINPRVAGEVRTSNDIPGWNSFDQIYWLVRSILFPLKFLQEEPLESSSLETKCIAVFLRSPFSGKLHVKQLLELTKSLPSFHKFGRGLAVLNTSVAASLDLPIVPTVDLISSPGVIVLVGQSAENDYSLIRQRESLLYISI